MLLQMLHNISNTTIYVHKSLNLFASANNRVIYSFVCRLINPK